jgi:hypothetical protein
LPPARISRVPGEKTLLQICVAIAACVPVSAGAAGIFLGVGMIPHASRLPALDSHYAYLSGLLLAIGLGFWSAVPGIERRTGRVRLLTGLVVVGGLARAVALVRDGAPGTAMQLALVMELVVTPLICLWQGRVAGLRPRPLSRGDTPGLLRPHPGQGR